MGKGDKRRPMKVTTKEFGDNFDKIFKSKENGKLTDRSLKKIKSKFDKRTSLEQRISEIKHNKKSGGKNE
tara:strand:+ start:9723 stop:9932 length:210 start_codon:yes stop_codon:yes gene_type:complete